MFAQKWLLYLLQTRSYRLDTQSSKSTESGLSLIECLMAIVVIALTGAMMLPPLFVASATRVQNRRAEQALQLAQGEVERVRALVTQKRQNAGNLPRVANAVNLSSVPAPNVAPTKTRAVTSACTSSANQQTEPTEPLGIILDADCNPDFLMQVFRTQGDNNQFELGVRVYSSSALGNIGNGLQTEEASLKYSTGTGNQKVFPLAVIYTDIRAVNSSQSMCNFQVHSDC